MRIATFNKTRYILLFSIITVILLSIILLSSIYINEYTEFSGERAYEDLKYQVLLGPRTIGSTTHQNVENWITTTLISWYWTVEKQETEISGAKVVNIIAKRGKGSPWIIIGSHYDSRLYADKDPIAKNRTEPVIGANDGASTVAILLELARIMPTQPDKQIWLVFFDAEDNGNIAGYDWDMGAQYFVDQLTGKPDSVIILDMLGDKDLNIYMEKNSNPELNNEIWDVASYLGYHEFIPSYKHRIIDDHLPFIEVGIKAIDIIDFDYPYWHTTQDTLDKVSAESLEIVGNTVQEWLLTDFDEMKKD